MSLKITGVLVALFGLGVATGFIMARKLPPKAADYQPVPRADPVAATANRLKERRMNEYKKLLKLSVPQEKAVARHFEGLGGDYNVIRADVRTRIGEAMARINTNVMNELTPEQRRVFLQHLRQRARKLEN
jgi:hypothetical protein